MKKRSFRIPNAMLLGFALVLGCSGSPAPTEIVPALPAARMPYERVARGAADPGENGPDDTTVIDAVKGATKPVPFSHFTHASNGEKGYGIPCRACHHKTPAGKDPEEGCVECHPVPKEGGDPAEQGPDDNLILSRPGQKMPEAPFTHFKHASSVGHKIACDKCHHTGDKVACTSCHEAAEGDPQMPSARRAFHFQCKRCHQEAKRSGGSGAPITCPECHRAFERSPGKEAVSLSRAMHLQCIDCHYLVAKAAPKAAAPVRICDGCHRAPAPPPTAEDGGVAAPPAAEAQAAAKAPEGEGDLESNKGAPSLVLDHVKQSQPAVPFPHKAHQDLGEPCAKCHHKGLKDPFCRKCHADIRNAKIAYHKSCNPCHKENGIGTKCGDCHKK